MKIKNKIWGKLFLVLAFFFLSVVFSSNILAANYPLEITQPQAGLNTSSRYYRAYPGIEYKVPVGVFGGAYPFTYSLSTAPAGMTINSSTGVITWSNPITSGSPHNVTVSVTDAENTTVIRSWTITVTTIGFIFVDGTNGHSIAGGGTGTIDNPFLSMIDFYGGTDYAGLHNSTYAGNFVYWRGGTYALEGYFQGTDPQQYHLGYPTSEKPHVWLAYPGETVVIDHNLGPRTNGAFINTSSWGGGNLFVSGIRFQDMLNHTWRTGGNATFYDVAFNNLGPGINGHNSSFLMWVSTGGSGQHNYPLVSNCTFTNLTGGTGAAFIKLYSVNKMVIADNTFSTATGSHEGIAVKGGTMTYIDIRNNRLTDVTQDAIGGNWNVVTNLEVRYNLILRADATYNGGGERGAMTINHDGTAGVAHIHHNTFNGGIVERNSGIGDGPFNLYNNVIVNENVGDNPAGSHINAYQVTATGLVLTDNLVCYSADNCIDASGNLTSAYSSYVGTRGHTGGSSSVPEVKVGDLNNDNLVNIYDYNILVGNFGRTGSGVVGDIDNNGAVNIFDYNLLVGNFGR